MSHDFPFKFIVIGPRGGMQRFATRAAAWRFVVRQHTDPAEYHVLLDPKHRIRAHTRTKELV